MSVTAPVKRILRRSALARRVVQAARRRRRSDDQVAAHQARHETIDRALADLFPALQEVQGPRLSEIESRLALIETHLPTFMNTIASGAGERRALRRAQVDLWERTEMIRRELMFELRYADQRERSAPVEPKIVNEEKLANARRDGLRLNLGCGHLALDGYVNVDERDLPGVDVVAPVNRLPVEPSEAEEIFSSHLVEHFPQEQIERELLPYWFSLLRPGGAFRAVVPDADAMFEGYRSGSVSYAELREVMFGGQEYGGDFHFNMYTVESLSQLLSDAGFSSIEVEDRARRNGACFEFQLVARRSG